MLKIIFILISMLVSTEINANSYSAYVVKKEMIGYKPYAEVLNQTQLKCLTDNIYFEAGNEKDSGKTAVALVTLNRLNHGRFPNTICGVVYQRTKWKCQFSWVCSKNRRVKYWSAYVQSQKIAKFVMLNYSNMHDSTKGATFFHRDDIKKPWFNTKIRPTVTIGRHHFYKL